MTTEQLSERLDIFMTTEQLLKRLEEAGYDVEGTLSRLLGDEELYIHLLDSFCRERSWEALELAVKSKKAAAAYEIAHTMKGSLVTLGLTFEAEELSRVMEDLTKSREEKLERDLPVFLRHMEALAEMLL